MPECPNCHQPVETTAIACPYCRTTLKAFGHPGVPLYRAKGEATLCDTCMYHHDDSCNYPQRPNARECTLYTSQSGPLAGSLVSSAYRPSASSLIKSWFQRNLAWVLLGAILLVSVLLALRG
jgi:C4-type Zn-finger protein